VRSERGGEKCGKGEKKRGGERREMDERSEMRRDKGEKDEGCVRRMRSDEIVACSGVR
jgi:hypothetical protein